MDEILESFALLPHDVIGIKFDFLTNFESNFLNFIKTLLLTGEGVPLTLRQFLYKYRVKNWVKMFPKSLPFFLHYAEDILLP